MNSRLIVDLPSGHTYILLGAFTGRFITTWLLSIVQSELGTLEGETAVALVRVLHEKICSTLNVPSFSDIN